MAVYALGAVVLTFCFAAACCGRTAIDATVSYCQDQNFVTGTLLSKHGRGEGLLDFWTFCAWCMHPMGFWALFTNGFPLVCVHLTAHRGVVAKVCHDVAAALARAGVQPALCAFSWFETLFTTVLTGDAVARVWDYILTRDDNDARWVFLHGTALAIQDQLRPRLLPCRTLPECSAVLCGPLRSLDAPALAAAAVRLAGEHKSFILRAVGRARQGPGASLEVSWQRQEPALPRRRRNAKSRR